MINIKQSLRSCALAAMFLGASGCCCCGGGGGDGDSFLGGLIQEQLDQQINTQIEKVGEKVKQAEQAAQAQPAEPATNEQQAPGATDPAIPDEARAAIEMLEGLAKQGEAAVKEAAADAKTNAKTSKPGSRDGEFQSDPIQKSNLTSARVRLQFAGSKVTGTFIGQYFVRPYSLKLEGTVSPSGAFELSSKADDNDLTISGTHEGDALKGDIKGLLRGKSIVAKFTAKRR